MFYKKDNILIDPRKRPDYTKIDGYPEIVILGHSTKWPIIFLSISKNDPNIVILDHTLTRYREYIFFRSYGTPMLYIFTNEGSLGLHTEIVKAAMNGAKYIINIGCSGSINEEFHTGDIVICNTAVRDSGFGDLLATPDQIAQCSLDLNLKFLNTASKLSSELKTFPKYKIGNVWCVNTLYYSKENALKAKEKGCDIVEMEMETGAITTGWINENFFNDNPIQYSQISYISDELPIHGGDWSDVFVDGKTDAMLKGKGDSLLLVLETFRNYNSKDSSTKY